MARILNITLEITDAEAAGLIANIGTAGVASIAGAAVTAASPVVTDTAPASTAAAPAPTAAAPAPAAADKPKGRGRPPKAKADAPAAAAAPVAVAPAPAAALPGVVMPGLPMPSAPAAKPPVSYAEIAAKFNDLVSSQKVTNDQVIAMYGKVGVTDPTALQTNETLRRALMDEFEAIG